MCMKCYRGNKKQQSVLQRQAGGRVHNKNYRWIMEADVLWNSENDLMIPYFGEIFLNPRTDY